MLRALRWIPWRIRETPSDESTGPLDLRTIHEQHADFVWTSLQRLGVRAADLPDVHQEVFVVIHRKLSSFDRSKPLRPWLFGICRCKAAAYRRRAWFRREEPSDAIEEVSDALMFREHDPEADVYSARARLDALLDKLDPDKRAVFVMFEIEGIPCEIIGETLGVPVGTVYSRLHAARKVIERAISCSSTEDKSGGGP